MMSGFFPLIAREQGADVLRAGRVELVVDDRHALLLWRIPHRAAGHFLGERASFSPRIATVLAEGSWR